MRRPGRACVTQIAGWAASKPTSPLARRFVPVDAEGRGRIDAYVQHALDKLLHGRRLKARSPAFKSCQDLGFRGFHKPC